MGGFSSKKSASPKGKVKEADVSHTPVVPFEQSASQRKDVAASDDTMEPAPGDASSDSSDGEEPHSPNSPATVVVASTGKGKANAAKNRVFSDPVLPEKAALRSKKMRKISKDSTPSTSKSSPVKVTDRFKTPRPEMKRSDSPNSIGGMPLKKDVPRRHSWGGSSFGDKGEKITEKPRRRSLQMMAETLQNALEATPAPKSTVKKGVLDFRPHKFDAFVYAAPNSKHLIRGVQPQANTNAPIQQVSAKEVLHESKDFYLVLIFFDGKQWVGLRAKSNDADKNKNFLFVNVANRLERLEEAFDEPWENFGVFNGNPTEHQRGYQRRKDQREKLQKDQQEKLEKDRRDSVGSSGSIASRPRNSQNKSNANLTKGSVYLINNLRTKEVWACAELLDEVDWELEPELPANFPWLDIELDCSLLHPPNARASLSVAKENPAILKSYEELFKSSTRKKFEP
jgi:hypothetical protein